MKVSTTDVDAKVTKMGDGGFRPAYNVQFAARASPRRMSRSTSRRRPRAIQRATAMRGRPGDTDAVPEWRARMGTDDAEAIDKERAATAECVNA